MNQAETHFFKMTAEQASEYAVPGDEIKELERGCVFSEFQFLDHQPINVSLSNEGGIESPDFICRYRIPLVSDRFKNVLITAGVDNLFYKAVILYADKIGIRKRYWLALPPRIRCLNREASTFEEDDPGLMPEAVKIVINPSKVGNYKIFCLGEVINRDIIVTYELKKEIEKAILSGIYFEALEE